MLSPIPDLMKIIASTDANFTTISHDGKPAPYYLQGLDDQAKQELSENHGLLIDVREHL